MHYNHGMNEPPALSIACPYCGKTIPAAADFCWYCTRQLVARAERPNLSHRTKPRWVWWLAGLLLIASLAALVTGCTPSPASPTPLPSITPIPPTPTGTPVQPRHLTVCIGQEPQTLYAYGGSSRSMWSVLEAIYDGPIDTVNFQPVPVIISEIPSQANGGLTLSAVTLNAGDEVVNTDGDLVALTTGVQYFPEGCASLDCATAYGGAGEVRVAQMSLEYQLIDGITWSDGTPLTADDSVYSFNISNDSATPVSKKNIDRTATYSAQDARTVVWTGKPGFLPIDAGSLFWLPLPAHTLNAYSAGDLLAADPSSRKPLGWGPYVIDEWVAGDHISLIKNPLYFRASEGLPKFDTLSYRFLSMQGDAALTALLAGECDVVDSNTLIETQLEALKDLQTDGRLKAVIVQGLEWEHLDFGIKPASYDDIYNPFVGDRPDFFGDVRVRQAFAQCLDRQAVVDQVFYGFTSIPGSYLSPNHPLAASGLPAYAFDTTAGQTLLDEVGWRDTDHDPATPRVALGVPGIVNGTPFSITWLISSNDIRLQAANILAASLQSCGIGVTIQNLGGADLYAPAPDGILFGRKFDLAQYAWSAGVTPPCFLYTTDEIPTQANGWLGTRYGGLNVIGYSNDAYDIACAAALGAGLDAANASANHGLAQLILAKDLPSIPLFYHIKAAATRPDLCGLQADPSSRSLLWNIETIDYGEACPAP